MLKPLTAFVIFASIALSGIQTFAQAQPDPSADEQAMRQQMQQTFQTIIQNMQAKGIDPQQMFQSIQNGTDPAELQQQLIDKGVIDQQTMTDLQANVQKLASRRIKDQLKATDEEWIVIGPLIQKAMSASAALGRIGGAGGGGGLSGFMTSQSTAASELSAATRELRAAIKDPATTPQQLADRLNTFRNARDKARAESTDARNQLASVLTVRQEGVLASLGILE